MKMSNADIVLNAAERVVKCKLAYISRFGHGHGYYITARVFAAVQCFFFFFVQNTAFLLGCRA